LSDHYSILFVTGCLFNESSGPYLSLVQTVQALDQRGLRGTVVGTGGSGDGPTSHWGVEALAFRRYGPDSLHFAPTLGRWLDKEPWRWDVASRLQLAGGMHGGPWLKQRHDISRAGASIDSRRAH